MEEFKYVTVSETETFVHSYLWDIVNRLQEKAKEEKERKEYFIISALVMSFFCFEACINYIGAAICEEEWKNERQYFKGKYNGTFGKYTYLAEKCKIKIEKGKRPYSSLKELNKFRDKIVHGKVKKERRKKVVNFNKPAVIENFITKYVSNEKLDTVKEDLKKAISELQIKAKETDKNPEAFDVDLFFMPLSRAKE
jgi:hypothetical protein